MTFAELWAELAVIGRAEPTGGYRRYSWTAADAACRAWFARTANDLGLRTDYDRNGNLWAWWGRPGGGAGRAVVTGSHLDSVPDGGAFDGPLGVASAFAALAELRSQGFQPARPIAVAAFTEEEGARFGVACLGSRLLAGVIDVTTNYLEHPEVVANRLCAAVDVVGDRERVIGGTDCGFGTFASYEFIAEDVVWAKLKALSDGAAVATKRLWGRD